MSTWQETLERHRNETPAGILALCSALLADEHTPPALRAIAATAGRAVERRQDAERARAAEDAASRLGAAHRVLRAYKRVDGWQPVDAVGMTAREAEKASGVRAAHKRCSDLLTSGYLEIVRDLEDPTAPLWRDGSRVLTITDAGVAELARLDALAAR